MAKIVINKHDIKCIWNLNKKTFKEAVTKIKLICKFTYESQSYI